MQDHFRQYFPENKNQIFIASSPGRLDVMGGIADYSGSLVLQMPIQQQTSVALAFRQDSVICVKTLNENQELLTFKINASDLLKNGKEVDYDFANEVLFQQVGGDWAAYVIGCLLVLQKEKDIQIQGFECYIESEVPVGKGVSSSAALEVATLKALAQAFEIKFFGTELPVLAQKVENQIVKAPCGLMDQLASYFGQTGKLLPILCQPDILFPLTDIPEKLHFTGIDSGLRHSVGGASYGDVRTAAFMGYTIIARLVGCDRRLLEACRLSGNIRRLPFQGYLANISVQEFEKQYADALPETISGKDFLTYFGISIDTVTRVKPETIYSVRQATLHPVYEHERVRKFISYLQDFRKNPQETALLSELGKLMYQSHESYSACGLGSTATDELVALAKTFEGKGIYGAKITGGGSGGTVCLLAFGKKGEKSTAEIHEIYSRKIGKSVTKF